MVVGCNTSVREPGNLQTYKTKDMTVNLNKNFVDAFGRDLEKGNIAERIGMLLFNLSTLKGVALSGEQKYVVYKLCKRVSENPESVQLSAEETVLLKDACAESLSAGAYGQIIDIIEQ